MHCCTHWIEIKNWNKNNCSPFTFYQARKMNCTFLLDANMISVFLWHLWKDILHFTMLHPTKNDKKKNTQQKDNDMTIRKEGYDPPNQKKNHHFHRIFALFRGNLTFIGTSPPSPPVAVTRISLRSVGLVRWKKTTRIWPAVLMWCGFSSSDGESCQHITYFHCIMNLNLVSGSLANLFLGSS